MSPLKNTFFLLDIFLEINAVAVMLVANGQGLIAVINPSTKADNIGML
nr:hypothetical protein BACY1_03160 [Tenacibaculum mesophilum]